ncbi:MAG: DegT/DnrJ/EryC1/StrS family aminotransferase [bacterium]
MAGPGLDLLGEEERAELLDVLEGRHLSRYRFDDKGDALPSKVYLFERHLEAMTGSRHCLGMNSCTSALLVGMWAAGIGRGMEVIVPGYTFVASIASIAYAGAVPVLAEIDQGLTLDPEDVRKKITPRTKAIMAVHMLGAPCDMQALRSIADEHGFLLLEDCAQAGGGRYRGEALGTLGAFGAFSLNVFKTFTAGDGGVLVTSDTDLYTNAFAIHDHGARPHRGGVADGNSFLGLNFRMHELTGAVARAQLKKLPGILTRLRANKQKLLDRVGDLPRTRERTVHDREGECATVAAFTFDTPEIADAVARKLGVVRLSASGKHNYANIPQLIHHKLPHGSCPITCQLHPFQGSYAPGTLPRTDDLLGRTVAVSVGVVDSYLGTGFGINIHSTDDDIARTASLLRGAVLDAVREVG